MARPTFPVLTDDDGTGLTGTVINNAKVNEIKEYITKGLELKNLTELTIAAGVITITEAFHTVDTEADAASDDLVTINGGMVGALVVLRAANDARTVIVRHNVDNIWLKGKTDLSLDDLQDGLLLIYDGSKWLDLGAGGGGVTKLSELTIDANKDWAAKNITNLGAGAHDVNAKLSEIATARGSKASLDARLDVVLNEDGTIKSGVIREGLFLSPANSDGSNALQAPFCEWLMVSPGKIDIKGTILTQSTYAFITWTNLATGQSQTVGTTYYVYACNNSGALAYRLHTDGTLTTVDSMDARKIGYFHNSPPNHPNYGAYNSEGDILMYSIFSDEEDKYVGMVDIGICKADIYEATLYWDGDHWFGDAGYQDYSDGAIAKSIYNKNPAVFTSWYEYKKAFARAGKFMLNSYQWYLAALGTPDPDTSAPNERLDITSKSAAFTVGETITGGTSGATATVQVDAATYLEISGRSATQFTNGETITGGTSGSTATVNNADGAVGLEPCQVWNTGSAPNYLNRKPEHSTFRTFPTAYVGAVKAGTAPKAVSTRGCYNCIGNVWEWVDLVINNGKYNNDLSLPAQNYTTDFDAHLGLPITTGSASSKYRNDYFWINTSGLRAARRSGGWTYGANAGLFTLILSYAPSFSADSSISSRGGKL